MNGVLRKLGRRNILLGGRRLPRKLLLRAKKATQEGCRIIAVQKEGPTYYYTNEFNENWTGGKLKQDVDDLLEP